MMRARATDRLAELCLECCSSSQSLDGTRANLSLIRRIKNSVFSEAFLVRGRVRAAARTSCVYYYCCCIAPEAHVLRCIALHCVFWILRVPTVIVDFVVASCSVFARAIAGARALYIVNFHGSDGNNGTNRCSLKRAFQRWLYCNLVKN